ncbi:hypothetical protein CCMA1212_004263 [Trichoderma ghanense]|uniref:Uncharacterized protein n=1 Tax=Trichoderma ghanense TaxID=65468 RepID=A0ABY2H628_9HYPO
MDATPLIGATSKPQQVFYHSGAGAGYNHCFMLIPRCSQSVIVVLTISVSQGGHCRLDRAIAPPSYPRRKAPSRPHPIR